MKKFSILMAAIALLSPAVMSSAFADSFETTIPYTEVPVTVDQTTTGIGNSTTGYVDLGSNVVIYGSSDTFQPNSIGDTNFSNSGQTTFSTGVGATFQ